VGSAIIFGIVKLLIGTRVTREEEEAGLDVSTHGERGYAYET
jgi:ammonia channel protein AmtB